MGDPDVIKALRRIDCETSDIDDDRRVIHAMLSNERVFMAVVSDENINYGGLAHAIYEVLISSLGLTQAELKAALADYDKIMGIKPAKSETEIKIDLLQAELNALRATLRNV